MPVTGLGYVALAFYLAIYWPLVAWAVRTGRRYRLSPVLSLPTAWVACEFLRGWVMSGFPWPFLAHALYQQITLIQIADVTGAYGVSFLAAMISGWLVECWMMAWPVSGPPAAAAPPWRRTGVIWGGVATVAAILAVIGYGSMRTREERFTDGPRIAVLQEDFPLSSAPPYGESADIVYLRYLALAGRAAQSQPDLIAFPETACNFPINIDFVELEMQALDGVRADSWSYAKVFHELTSALARGDYEPINRYLEAFERRLRPEVLARQPGGRLPRMPSSSGPPVAVLLGCAPIELVRDSSGVRGRRFNSVVLYDSDGVQRRERYDKTHLVPFGEFVPFRDSKLLGISLRPLYVFLNRLSPFSNGGRFEYSLTPGREHHVFDLPVDGRTWRFGAPICYEDVMPYVARAFAWRGGSRRADFLINVSNDGWFLHSAELPQHLAICAFRAVENRVGIARAVNTGVSGFIDPAGRISDLVERDGRTVGPGITGYRVAPIRVDARDSLYGRYGDWFAIVCTVVSAFLWLEGIVTRWIFALQQRVASWGRRAARREGVSA